MSGEGKQTPCCAALSGREELWAGHDPALQAGLSHHGLSALEDAAPMRWDPAQAFHRVDSVRDDLHTH